MEDKKKFSLSTDTDLHFDMLADKSKLKLVPNFNMNEQINEIDEENENDNSSKSSVKSDKMNFNLDDADSFSDSSKDLNKIENNVSNNSFDKDNFNSQPSFEDSRPFDENINLNQNAEYTQPEQVPQQEQTSFQQIPQQQIPQQMNMDPYNIPFEKLDKQTQQMRKMEVYAELLSIKRQGISLTKDYNLNSDYNEMVFEVQYWTSYQKKKDAVEIGKNFMINAIYALEFMNESYDPFGLKLKGWSEQLELNKDSYNGVFGELYEKYKGTGRKVEPEIKLILMVGASAASFHASKKMAESLPGLDSVLQNNPELLTKLNESINNNISSQGGSGNESNNIKETQKKMYEEMQKLKQQQKNYDELKKQQDKIDDNNKRLSETINMVNNKKSNDNDEQRPDITNILNKIKAQNAARKADDIINNNLSEDSDDRVSINSASNKSSRNSESVTLGSDGKPKRKKRSGKSTISIVTN